jgi:hypothetical protein
VRATGELDRPHALQRVAESMSAKREQFVLRGIKYSRETEITSQENMMGRSLILWMVGVPIPIIILLWFFMH